MYGDINNLHDVVAGLTADNGVRYDKKLDLVCIDVDAMPNRTARNRMKLACELSRKYNVQAWETTDFPYPAIVIYCGKDGNFPMDEIGVVVKSGGTYWRYMPTDKRTGDTYADLLTSIRKCRVPSEV